MYKHITSSILTCFILLSLFSCGEEKTSAETTADAGTASAETTEALPESADHLPPDLDYGGESVRFLYREEVADEFYIETADGDLVHDAIYNSMRSVEERLNVDIDVILLQGHIWEQRAGYMSSVTQSVMAGDHTYDWVDLMIGNSPLLAKDGIFLNLLDNPMIDLSQPWYIPNLKDTVSVNNQLYFVSGDASLGYLKCAFCMYFNKNLAKEYQLENLYSLVKDGKWTVDKLMEISALTSQDLNNDGKYDMNDRLGFVMHDNNHPKGFMAATETFMFIRNGSKWEFTLGSNEHDLDVAQKMYRLKKETAGSYFYEGTNAGEQLIAGYENVSAKFCNDEIFIISAEVDDVVSQFRSMKSPYGIVPYPKYDEAQKEYHTSSRNTHNAFSLTTTCENPEMAGAVLEALGASNYRKVLPSYFEVALKNKYASDDEDAEIFDIIHQSMILDFGYTYSNAVTNPDFLFLDAFNYVNNFASQAASKTKQVNKAYEKYMEAIEQNCAQ